jgi:Fur family peroxide stress response transcriptional regulator
MIFEQVKVMVPNISLGTVYRNLALLASVGEISRIPVLDGADRFDAVTEPHYHVICRSCGSVEDLTLPVDPKLNQKASRVYEGRILSHEICFQGICKKCLENP